MEITETLYVTDRKKWRKWLSKNHDKKKEIWLIYYKKHTGKPTIPYNDAVEEALCFGWIDSTVKRIDDEKHVQRYSPRNKNSVWSDSNVKRVKKMINEGKMTKIGLEKYKAGQKKYREIKESKAQAAKKEIPPHLKKALSKNKKAEKIFKKWPPSHRLRYIYWINEAKKEETKNRRAEKAVKMILEGL
jgi:uncharacterized protein YdeI (YjbR/CyaY-like superfamily)